MASVGKLNIYVCGSIPTPASWTDDGSKKGRTDMGSIVHCYNAVIYFKYSVIQDFLWGEIRSAGYALWAGKSSPVWVGKTIIIGFQLGHSEYISPDMPYPLL